MAARDRVLALMAAAAVLLVGCGGRTSETTDTAATASSYPSAASVSPTGTTGRPAPLVIDVTIEGSEVSPSNAQLRAAVDQPIVLRVASDSADQLHVHSTPEHTFDVGVGPGQSFEFTVGMPGRVDVELHQLHKTIATIQVQ